MEQSVSFQMPASTDSMVVRTVGSSVSFAVGPDEGSTTGQVVGAVSVGIVPGGVQPPANREESDLPPLARPQSVGSWSLLSVREDWESQGELSPHKSMSRLLDEDGSISIEVEHGTPSMRSISKSYQQGLRSGRRTGTLTSARSPKVTACLGNRPGGSPLHYGVHSIQNRRNEMEDAHRAVLGQEGRSPSSISDDIEASLGSLSYFAIFDGHGGARAAEFSGEHLCTLLAANREGLVADPIEALRLAFARTEEEWSALALKEELMDGTTAAVALVDRAAGRCIVGNVGDSEILLGWRDSAGEAAFQTLTEVHHLKRSASEAARIAGLGGKIWHGRLGHPKISAQVLSLSVTRAIGDIFFKDDSYTDGVPSGLIADPYITSVEVCTAGVTQQFLVIACDGLWDTVTYAQAANFVLARLNSEAPQAISEGLVHLARDAGSSDNITVMVVVLSEGQ